MEKKYTDAVLFSGGLDSTVTLAECMATSAVPLLIFCNHGFRSSERERRAVQNLARHYSVAFKEVTISLPTYAHVMRQGGCYIYYEYGKSGKPSKTGVPPFVIPYRNYAFISMALMYCGVYNVHKLWLGFDYYVGKGCSEDKSPAFVKQFQKLVDVGKERGTDVTFITPLQGMRKAQIIEQGRFRKIPFKLTWTCYNDLRLPCGICNACVGRQRAFCSLGQRDPLIYASRKMLMSNYTKQALTVYDRVHNEFY